MKLIKLQDKFILVSDEEIKEGDYVYSFKSKNIFKADSIEYMEKHNMIEDFDKSFYINSNQSKKIIAGIPELPSIDFSLLSEKDCKRIGWVDVEKLASKEVKEHDDIPLKECLENYYIRGFKTAQSLNDKKFSLEDIEKLAFHITDNFAINSWENREYKSGKPIPTKQIVKEFIQSLQQTEWNVEVNKLNQVTKINQQFQLNL